MTKPRDTTGETNEVLHLLRSMGHLLCFASPPSTQYKDIFDFVGKALVCFPLEGDLPALCDKS